MPREPRFFERCVIKQKRKPLISQIRTLEQAQMVHDLALEEIKRRQIISKNKQIRVTRNTPSSIVINSYLTIDANTIVKGGITLIIINKTTWRLSSINVDSQFRLTHQFQELGIGKALWDKGIELAKKKGAKRITFEALKGTYPFYKKLGAKKLHWEDIPSLSESIEMYYDIP